MDTFDHPSDVVTAPHGNERQRAVTDRLSRRSRKLHGRSYSDRGIVGGRSPQVSRSKHSKIVPLASPVLSAPTTPRRMGVGANDDLMKLTPRNLPTRDLKPMKSTAADRLKELSSGMTSDDLARPPTPAGGGGGGGVGVRPKKRASDSRLAGKYKPRDGTRRSNLGWRTHSDMPASHSHWGVKGEKSARSSDAEFSIGGAVDAAFLPRQTSGVRSSGTSSDITARRSLGAPLASDAASESKHSRSSFVTDAMYAKQREMYRDQREANHAALIGSLGEPKGPSPDDGLGSLFDPTAKVPGWVGDQRGKRAKILATGRIPYSKRKSDSCVESTIKCCNACKRGFSACTGGYETPSLVTPFILIGNREDSRDMEKLLHHGVTHILNCSTTLPNCHPETFIYMNIHIADAETQEITDFIPRASSFIQDAIDHKTRVFVHCVAGVSRSVSMVLGHLMLGEKLPLLRGYNQVARRRPIISPNSGFRLQLAKYEVEVLGRSSVANTRIAAWNFYDWNAVKGKYRNVDDGSGGCTIS